MKIIIGEHTESKLSGLLQTKIGEILDDIKKRYRKEEINTSNWYLNRFSRIDKVVVRNLKVNPYFSIYIDVYSDDRYFNEDDVQSFAAYLKEELSYIGNPWVVPMLINNNLEDEDMISENENEKPNKLVNKLRDQVNSLGINLVSNLVGNLETLLKVAFNDDLKEFYKTTGYVPYTIDEVDGGRMHIDKILIDRLNLEDKPHWIDKEKKLGHFIFGTKNGPKYTFNARATGKAIDVRNGQEFMQVAGMCGELDLGFGYIDLKQKEILGKRGRTQIFKQIIEKYNLDSYI